MFDALETFQGVAENVAGMMQQQQPILDSWLATPANLKGQTFSQIRGFVFEGIRACMLLYSKSRFLSDMWQRISDKRLLCFHAASEKPSKGQTFVTADSVQVQ